MADSTHEPGRPAAPTRAAGRLFGSKAPRAWYRPIWFLILFVIAGCGRGGSIPSLGEVSGIVTLDGQPLADAIVTFAPAAGRPSQGITGTDGRYTLAYTTERSGAMVGDHVVRISTDRYVERSGGAVEQITERVPAMYNAQSTLTATVKAGKNDLPFQLQSK